MWEIIPPVQLKPSTIDAKARLSFSGGSEWPRAQLRHYWCAPGFGCTSLQTSLTSALISRRPAHCIFPPGGASLPESALVRLRVCVFVRRLQWVGVDCMYKQPVGGKKMRQVVQELWSICSSQKSPTLFTSIKVPFFSVWEAARMARQQCDRSLSCLPKAAHDQDLSPRCLSSD